MSQVSNILRKWFELLYFIVSASANEIGHSQHHETLLFKSRDYTGKHFHRFPHLLLSLCASQPQAYKEWEWKNRWDTTEKNRPPRGLKGLQLSLYVLTATKEEKNEGRVGQAITSTERLKKGRGNGQKVHFHSHKRAKEIKKISSSLCPLSRF